MKKEIELYHEKLKRYYDGEGRLIQYPSKRPLRVLALLRIAQRLEPSRKYTEKEVNEAIRASIAFGDIELIRREMFQYGIVGRQRDGSEYWLEESGEAIFEKLR